MATAVPPAVSAGSAELLGKSLLSATEEAQIASEALLRQFIKHTPAAVAMFDCEVRYLQASDRWITDYRLEGRDLVGRSHYEVFPDIPLRWKEVHCRVLKGAVERCAEDPFPRADGSVEWLEWEVRPWFKADGTVGGLIMFTQAITERKRIAEALRASEERLKSAMTHSPIGMAVVAPDGRFLEVNPALAKLLGYSPQELLARDFQSITHPDDLEADLDLLRKTVEARSEGYQLEKRYLHRDGRAIWIQLNASIVFDERGKPRHFIAQIQDISERKRSERRQRRLLETPILGIAFGQPDGRITAANDEYLRIVGYSRDELEAGKINFREVTPAEYAPQNELALAEIEAKGTARPWELELTRKDGARIPVLLGVSALDDDHSQDVAFVFDLSERRDLERKLQHAQKMEAVGRLAAGVAHDFNNVLGAVSMCCDLLRDDLSPGHPGLDEVNEIRKAAERAIGLTRQLLAFSRQQVLEPRVLDLNELVTNLDKLLKRLLGDDVALAMNLAPFPCAVKADPGQLEQVIMNLAVNARDAMPHGGTITIETGVSHFEQPYTADNEDALPPGAYVHVTVADTGIGMDEATKARLFEPFFTTKEVGKGTGLGLSTVYGIVRQSGGAIDVKSEVGAGARFRVMLPHVNESVKSTPPTGLPESIGGRETLLLVEDDPAIRQTARKLLVRLGYKVLESDGPAAALELGRVYVGSIDLLLT
ncbi:MAG TPA: PAS domain S-box protein, partial [Polyangiaceae bacterium]|nr:PAS domain S-box protein [Polyangiaceae bacterium]